MTHSEMTKVRLHSWSKILAELEATPQVLIGVVISGRNKGKLVVQVTEDISIEAIKLFIKEALRQLNELGDLPY